MAGQQYEAQNKKKFDDVLESKKQEADERRKIEDSIRQATEQEQKLQ